MLYKIVGPDRYISLPILSANIGLFADILVKNEYLHICSLLSANIKTVF